MGKAQDEKTPQHRQQPKLSVHGASSSGQQPVISIHTGFSPTRTSNDPASAVDMPFGGGYSAATVARPPLQADTEPSPLTETKMKKSKTKLNVKKVAAGSVSQHGAKKFLKLDAKSIAASQKSKKKGPPSERSHSRKAAAKKLLVPKRT